MYSRYRIPSMLYRGVRYRNSIVPYVRRFSSPEILVPKKKFHVSKGIFTFVALTGFGATVYYFLDKTYRFKLFEYAREHKNTILKDGSWRDALALALVDMYRSTGIEIITMMHCGRFLGKTVADDNQYVFLHFLIFSNSPEIMTVLLMLSNVDSTCLTDAIHFGGIEVLERLYDHNKKECEIAIMKMIKMNISFINPNMLLFLILPSAINSKSTNNS